MSTGTPTDISIGTPNGRLFRRLRASRGYDLAMRTMGGLWYLALAFEVSAPIPGASATAPQLVARASAAAFYAILCVLLLLRPPAKAEAEGIAPRAAAFVGTYLPWTIPVLGSPAGSAALNLASAGLVILGMVLTLVTVAHLGRAFSLVPQARKVVRSGPYRWLRHPLYFAEEVAVSGTVLQFLSPVTIAIFVAHLAIQIRRIYYEEDLLRRTFPEYAAYAAGNWRLVPFVW
ncbi:methyltransferase family protein [Rhodopila globiformis]|uniref:Protein-S-isoprenylcysteine methyltransferase n=1 Tax=Rhodopila globiformis TaxID=1071 RepID=A0A2S6N8X0_RHOGL|nr:isoprenylcysteine carboxylmethyltransferase family protein [Rhodopila globiformis]PPQ31041.1 protein-S-isoprenylcysteine methyltransferase [Rhodopila globiformis]